MFLSILKGIESSKGNPSDKNSRSLSSVLANASVSQGISTEASSPQTQEKRRKIIIDFTGQKSSNRPKFKIRHGKSQNSKKLTKASISAKLLALRQKI
jgi:hypothetical protein